MKRFISTVVLAGAMLSVGLAQAQDQSIYAVVDGTLYVYGSSVEDVISVQVALDGQRVNINTSGGNAALVDFPGKLVIYAYAGDDAIYLRPNANGVAVADLTDGTRDSIQIYAGSGADWIDPGSGATINETKIHSGKDGSVDTTVRYFVYFRSYRISTSPFDSAFIRFQDVYEYVGPPAFDFDFRF